MIDSKFIVFTASIYALICYFIFVIDVPIYSSRSIKCWKVNIGESLLNSDLGSEELILSGVVTGGLNLMEGKDFPNFKCIENYRLNI